jgi:hypothetical protein
MKPLFSNKPSFDWISDNSDSMMRFVRRIKETEISPLVEELTFGKNTWKNQEMVEYIKKCISLFPENSIKRMFCKKIELLPTVWFKKGSTASAPVITDKLDEAEDKYSLPCGYSDFLPQEKLNIYQQCVELYEFPDFIPDLVVYVYLAYVVIHEFSHLVQKPGFHWRNYAKNFLPDHEGDIPHYLLINNEKIDPCDWQGEFVVEALKYEPITTYSGVYRDVDDIVRVHEYMADYMSSYLMGFTMNPILSSTPVSGFEDRPELKDKIRAFINAEAVIQF